VEHVADASTDATDPSSDGVDVSDEITADVDVDAAAERAEAAGSNGTRRTRRRTG
jgi:hypothetical protein